MSAVSETNPHESGTPTWWNWARVESARPRQVVSPGGVEQLAAVIAGALDRGATVKAVGAGHSFTAIAATDGVMVDCSGLRGLIDVDLDRARVRLGAGTYLHELPALLGPLGLALENMGDIDRQTIAGATSTGTHGTGARFQGLAARIVGVTLVTADGSVLTIDEDTNAELLPAVRLGLGALGVLADVTVQCVPRFLLRAHEAPAGLEEVLDGLEEWAAADHFEFYWFPGTDRVQTKTNQRLSLDAGEGPPSRLARLIDEVVVQNGALRAACEVGRIAPPLTPHLNRLATRLLGEQGYTDLSHKVFTSPRRVRFRETEFAVPRQAMPEAMRALRDLIERRRWIMSFPVEARVAAADDNWLSTAQGRDSGYLAVHRYWREDHTEIFTEVDALMRDFDGRPHWGKIHHHDASALAERYPHFTDFLAVRDRLDPERVFANDYLRRVLGD